MREFLRGGTALWLVVVATAALAEPSREAAVFGAREYIQDMSLSPDGKKIAIVQPMGARGSALAIADLVEGTPPKVILSGTGDPERLRSCRWSTSSRLVCRVYIVRSDAGFRIGLTRMIAVNADGGGLTMLTEGQSSRALDFAYDGGAVIDWTGGKEAGAAVLITRAHVPEVTIGTRLAKSKKGLGVDRLDTVTLKRSVVEQPRQEAVEYITDGLGEVRVMGMMGTTAGGYAGDEISYFYRRKNDRDWGR